MNVEGALQELLDLIMEEYPELAEVFREAKRKEQTDRVAMAGVLNVIETHPEMAERLNQAAMDIMAPLRKEGELLAPKTPEGPGYLFDSGVGLPRMNPIYEAALLERLQFDGDIPEARTGPLPPGTKPAVPVATDARNPVAIGHMLEAASEAVFEKVTAARAAHLEHVEEIAKEHGEQESEGTDLVTTDEPDYALLARGDAESDPEGYRRGEVPALVETEGLSGSEIAVAHSAPDAGAYAWKFISTTQGRRSAERTIWGGVADRLRRTGVKVHDWSAHVAGPEILQVAWTVDLAGPKATQPRFATVDIAIAALASKVVLDDRFHDLPETIHLVVEAVNTSDIRQVGWTARVMG